MSKYESFCTEILANVGGKENVKNAVHCMTRLRIGYVDESKINVDAIKAIKGVLGAQFSGGQFQIIIGQQVADVYPEFCKLVGVEQGKAIEENLDKEPFDIKKIPSKMLDYISGSIVSMIPIMMGTAFFKLFYTLLGPAMLNVCEESSQLMQTINMIGQAGFYFMPVFCAYGAAKKLNTSIPLALLLGVLLIDPNWINIVANSADVGFKFYGVFPTALGTYSQSVLPSLIAVWVLKYVYDFFNKIIPNVVKVIGVPFLTIIVMAPVLFCVCAPIGNLIGTGLSGFFSWLYSFCGPLAVALIGAFWMFMVATGMHVAVIQIALLNITTLGYDPIILAGSNASNLALMGMAIAYFLRSKGEEKQIAGANAVTLCVGGISEPTIFAVLLRNKKAMIVEIIGGFVGGLVIGLFGGAIFIPGGVSNFLCVMSYVGGSTAQTIAGVGGCLLAFVTALVVGLIIGFDDGGKTSLKNFKGKPKKEKA
ncbi:PTS transporter subunit EIIC [Floccifex sp.]|uniref:PTS transporter subunit EIIC n=1 Tax=Floccifex sp. TaxID=2815810 RepID=UPI003EFBF273